MPRCQSLPSAINFKESCRITADFRRNSARWQRSPSALTELETCYVITENFSSLKKTLNTWVTWQIFSKHSSLRVWQMVEQENPSLKIPNKEPINNKEHTYAVCVWYGKSVTLSTCTLCLDMIGSTQPSTLLSRLLFGIQAEEWAWQQAECLLVTWIHPFRKRIMLNIEESMEQDEHVRRWSTRRNR